MRFLILFILLVISNAEKSKKGTKKKKSNDPKKVTEVKDVESTAPLPSFDVPRHTNDCKYHTCSYHIRVWYIECSYSDFSLGQVTLGFFELKNTEKLQYRISIIFDVHVRHLVRRIGYITDPYHVTCPGSLD